MRKENDHDTYVSGGYVQKDAAFIRSQQLGPRFKYEFRNDQWQELLNFVDFLNTEGIELLLVQSPIDSALNQNTENTIEIDQRSQELDSYINFNNLLNLHYPKDLYDLHHLNQRGVNSFNRILIEKLKMGGFLK